MKKFAFLLLIMILLASCSQPKEEEKKSIKIGYLGGLTGGSAQYGLPGHRMEQIAIDEINAQGGILGRQVELVVEDDACDAKKAVNAFYKLVEADKVDMIVGGHCSPSTLAIAPIANEKKKIILAVMSSTNDLTKFGDDYIFRMTVPSKYWSEGLAGVLIRKGMKEAMLFYIQLDYPKSAAQSFKEIFQEMGGKIILEEGFDPDEKDFRTTLLKADEELKKNPKAMIYIASQTADQAHLFLKQAKELGIKAQFIGENIALSPKNYELTQGYIDGAMYGFPYVDFAENEIFAKALQKYKEKHGEELQWALNHFANAYDAPYVLKQAIEACNGTDSDCLRAVLKTMTYTGASGTFKFDVNGDPAEINIGVAVVGKGGYPDWMKDEKGKVVLFRPSSTK